MILCFSGTGNSRYIAKKIAGAVAAYAEANHVRFRQEKDTIVTYQHLIISVQDIL